MELSRVLRPSRNQQTIFKLVILVFLASNITSIFDLQIGTRLNGLALILIALWSIRNDIAWRNLQHKLPLTRYIARCLALGFVWLGLGGGLSLIFGAQIAGPRYDAVLHVVFIGFVISMIFGHAPIIFPAILGVPIEFHSSFYIHLTLLHLSLVMRVIADYSQWHTIRLLGGLLNEVAILLFLAMSIYSVRTGLSTKKINTGKTN